MLGSLGISGVQGLSILKHVNLDPFEATARDELFSYALCAPVACR